VAHLLLLVLLLLKRELFLRIVARAPDLLPVISRALAGAITGSCSTGTLLALLPGLGLTLHGLHHGRVHHIRHGLLSARGGRVGTHTASLLLLRLLLGPTSTTTTHSRSHLLHLHLLHLLHHGRVHGAHIHIPPTHGHLLLHHGKVLLHALPILRHHLRRHTTRHTLLSTTTLLLAGVSALIHIAEVLAAAAAAAVFVAEVTAGLGFLDFDGFAEDFERAGEGVFDGGFAVEGYEAETTGAAGVFVDHECCVDDAPELCEELLEVLFCGFLADAANEDLACLFLFIAGNGALGIDLEGHG
jgi:hypothetical protein